jgi:hypothetical protein
MAMERVWMDIAKSDQDPSASQCPAHESIHVMDVTPNQNPTDIQISMDIHVFTHYVNQHNNISTAFQQYQQ